MKVAVLNINGDNTGREIDLPDEMFSIEPNQHVMYLAVKAYLAAQRQGTHKSKERGEIKGSTRKIKKQKGSGTARAGSLKNPLFKGGGRVFGPKPRNYSQKMNKKVKTLARNSALSHKAQQSEILIVEDFDFDTPKTKQFVEVLQNLKLEGKKTLLVLDELKQNVHLAARNVAKNKMMNVTDLNTYSILNANTLIISEGAAKSFVQ